MRGGLATAVAAAASRARGAGGAAGGAGGAPEPTRLPPSRQQNETIARTEKSASVAGPNLRAKRSGSVSSRISFSGLAKKMPAGGMGGPVRAL